MIICNDIMAYMFGFFFGRTPLIKLSPKKTWEGFIGGAISTVLFGVLVSIVRYHFAFIVQQQHLLKFSVLCWHRSVVKLHFAVQLTLSRFEEVYGELFCLELFNWWINLFCVGSAVLGWPWELS